MPHLPHIATYIVKHTRQLFDNTISLIFPRVCELCHTSLVAGEHILCLDCDMALPRANIHRSPDNRISQRLARRIPDCRVASWFYYDSGEEHRRLILDTKYRDRPELGRALGEMFANEILADGFFDNVDIILYIPMHALKFAWRGYNQSRYIADGVSRATGIPVGKHLHSPVYRPSQTRHSGAQRFANARGKFVTRRGSELDGKHVLIVDDVITTGSTIVAAIDSLLDTCSPASVRVLSLGITQQH